MKLLFVSIAAVSNKVKADKVNAFAAEASLFIIMSFIPCLLLLMILTKYTPLTEDLILKFLEFVFPKAFLPTITQNFSMAQKEVSNTLVFITIFSILWASGKGFVSLIDGLNSVFDIKEHRNWIVLRLYAILYTIIFLVIILLCTVIYFLGHKINDYFEVNAPMIAKITDRIIQFRVLIMIVILTLLFTFLYVAIPNRHTKIRRQFPGALFSAVGFVGFSFFFSLYINYSKNLSFIYGGLTMIICTMLWLYVCMYIFLVGAEVNLYVEQFKTSSAIDKATDVTHTH